MRLVSAILISLAGSAAWADTGDAPAKRPWGKVTIHDNPAQTKKMIDDLLNDGKSQPAAASDDGNRSHSETVSK
jgi:hypothetical protein